MSGEWREKLAERQVAKATQPDPASGGWRDVVNARAIKAAENPKPRQPRWYDAPRAALKGLTLGTSDEIGAGIAAGMAKLTGDDRPVSDIYSDIHQAIGQEDKQYSEENPIKSGAAELGGALLAGGVSGAKVLATQAAKKVPTWLSAAGLGFAEGGIYGGAAADPGERMKGAAIGATIGAVAAPVGGAIVNKGADLVGRGAKVVGRKISETPEGTARRVLRDVGESTGFTPDELAARYESLGPEGRVLDIDESMRSAGRAIGDQLGPAKRQMRDAMESRQLGQVDRLAQKIQQTTGTQSAEFADSVAAIAARRAEQAGPLYQNAFNTTEPSEAMLELAKRPSLKAALKKGQRLAADAGEDVSEVSFKQFHFAKMALDDIIGARMRSGDTNAARTIIKLKNELLSEMDELAPDYRQARNLYAGDSALIDAGENGLKFYKLTPDEIDDLVKGMADSEREMFRRGAVKAIVDRLEDTQLTHDAARQLVNKKSLQRKLGQLFDSPDAAADFIRQALREREFSRTRQVVTGGSPTSQNLAAQEGINNMTGSALSLSQGDPATAAGLELLKRVFGKKSLSPETIEEMTRILIDDGLSPEQVRGLFSRSTIATQASRAGQTLPPATRGAIGASSGSVSTD